MRTTLNIDEPVLLAVRSRARNSGRTLGEVVSELLADAMAPPDDPREVRNGLPLLPASNREIVTSDLVAQLRDELQNQATAVTACYLLDVNAPGDAAIHLGKALRHPRHGRIGDSVSITDSAIFKHGLIGGPKMVTDVYLLGLVHHHGRRLATFDRRLHHRVVCGAGPELVHRIDVRLSTADV